MHVQGRPRHRVFVYLGSAHFNATGVSMFVVTGGAGFIGSNIIQALNAEVRRGFWSSTVSVNFAIWRTSDFPISWNRKIFACTPNGALPGWIDAIFHQGRAPDTSSRWTYMMEQLQLLQGDTPRRDG